MKFIRDIISEKRAGRQDSPPQPADVWAPRIFSQSPGLGQYSTPNAARPEPFVLSHHQTAPQQDNIFAADDEDGDEAGNEARSAVSDVEAQVQDHPVEEAGAEGQEPPVAIGRDEPAGGQPQFTAFALRDAPEADAIPAPTTHAAASDQARARDLGEMPFVAVQQPDLPDQMINDAGLQVPPPAAGRGSSRSGRVKTRLLGFNPQSAVPDNPFDKAESRKDALFPVGWLVVVAGPGRGASFALHDGVSKVGRGDDQTIPINFGDNSISRENHVSVAYDPEQNAFYIGQSGRANIVRLNNKPLLSTEQMRSGDHVRIGETTQRLAALCSDGFTWGEKA